MTTERPTSGKFPEAVERHRIWWARIASGVEAAPKWLAGVLERKRLEALKG